MKEVFEALKQTEKVKARLINDPIYNATFFALYKFVCDGGTLSDLSWFKLAKDKKLLQQLQKAA